VNSGPAFASTQGEPGVEGSDRVGGRMASVRDLDDLAALLLIGLRLP
jgi:hypothetical protein